MKEDAAGWPAGEEKRQAVGEDQWEGAHGKGFCGVKRDGMKREDVSLAHFHVSSFTFQLEPYHP